jgi:TRAP-type C4-dicarboxylate transport system permease small subunit
MRRAWGPFQLVMRRVNLVMGYGSALLIVLSTVAISFEVVARYFFRAPHDWHLELNIFLLIASTFMAAAFTQEWRAHVGIEVLESLLSPRWNWWRHLLADILVGDRLHLGAQALDPLLLHVAGDDHADPSACRSDH